MTNDVSAARTVRAAVVQSAPVLFDTPRTLDKLADLTTDAARQRTELVVFAEAFIGGYPKGHDFGSLAPNTLDPMTTGECLDVCGN